ncbi:MAG: LbtU family siderophore porin [Deltaproteobacteria bacterium]|nr:LbtU family siderophore porin [Deltaproteobacteria bacterium]
MKRSKWVIFVLAVCLGILLTGVNVQAAERDDDAEHRHTVKGLSERVRKIEEKMKGKEVLGKWAEKITLSGTLEVEVNYTNMNFNNPANQDAATSDITLAKMELGVDADIVKHVQGHVLLLWEEDDTEPVDLDEGFIIIDGLDRIPFYLNAGKQYVPFGYYESHFISNPITLEIGETRESAIKIGFKNDWLEICGAVFNGDIDETGQSNHARSYASQAILTIPENSTSRFSLMAGISYISNIGDTNGLGDDISGGPGTVVDHIGGWSAFLSAAFLEKFALEAEYVGATKKFQAGELSFDGGAAFQPRAWNLELAYVFTDDLEFAVKYEGSRDLGDFQPESQYGAALSWGVLDNASLAFECLYGTFDNNDKRTSFTVQFAVSF